MAVSITCYKKRTQSLACELRDNSHTHTHTHTHTLLERKKERKKEREREREKDKKQIRLHNTRPLCIQVLSFSLCVSLALIPIQNVN